jgi:uracil-DNA glycosylase
MRELADECWPFHNQAIQFLRPKVILCFGNTAGKYVCARLGATRLTAVLVERNNRKWCSRAFAAPDETNVVSATHPSIADWCSAAADITSLIQQALSKS